MPTIDADAHVIETEHTWDYMDQGEAPFRPRTVSVNNPVEAVSEWWLVDGRIQPKQDNIGKETSRESREMLDVAARLRHMDELEVDVQVLYPSLFLRPLTSRPEVDLALCKSYNRWLSAIWEKGNNRLRWAVIPPLLSMDQALKELSFGKQHGACARSEERRVGKECRL